MFDSTVLGSLAMGNNAAECPTECLAGLGLLDMTGVPGPMLAASANLAAWPIGYGRCLLHVPATCSDFAVWPFGFGSCLHTCAPGLCRSRSPAYWIRQAVAYLCLRLVPILQPGLLDMAGLCIPVP